MQLTQNIRSQFKGLSFVPILVFLIYSGMLFSLNDPVGTYDFGGDDWSRGNWIAGMLDTYDYSNDYYMSNKDYYKFYTPVYWQLPLVKAFGDYERFLSYLSPIVIFSGLISFYLLCFLLSRSVWLSFLVSFLFISSTTWFSTGDIISFIPFYALSGVTFATIYVFIILILVQLFGFNEIPLIIYTIITAGMLWIHSVTFLGPGVATIGAIYFFYWRKTDNKRTLRRKVAIGLTCIAIFVLAMIPHAVLHLDVNKVGKVKTAKLEPQEKAVFLEDINATDKYRRINPLYFYYNLQMLREIKGLVILIPLAGLCLFYFYGNWNVRFFFISMIVCFLFNLIALEINYLLDHRLRIEWLVRNSKWLYIYLLLIVFSAYPDLRKQLVKDERLSKRRFAILASAMLILFFIPHVTRSFTQNTILHKTSEKMSLDNDICPERGKFLEGFCNHVVTHHNNPEHASIISVNNDANALSAFLSNSSKSYTYAGPNWLRYKSGVNMRFNHEDGQYLLWKLDKQYLDWKEMNLIWQKINVSEISREERTNYLNQLFAFGVDRVVLEKFSKLYSHETKYYYPVL